MTAGDIAVIFDMDGVLVDSEPLQVRTYVQAGAELGVTLDEEEFVRRCVFGGWSGSRYWVSQGGAPEDWEKLFARKSELYAALAREELQLMPGALDLLRDLRDHGVPCALATSAGRLTVAQVCDVHDFSPWMSTMVMYEDVTRRKPHPDPFLLAAARLGVPPKRCVVIEDAPKGIAAAKAAGMRAVGLVNRLASAETLAGADLLVTSLEQLSAARLRAAVEMLPGHQGCERYLARLVPHRAEWADLFAAEAEHLRAALGEHLLAIEHVGSTAVPGLEAKPILDVVVAVPHIGDPAQFDPLLAPLGYLRKPDEDPLRLYFVKEAPDGRTTHHLNITEPGTECWVTHVRFRDYLLAHPEAQEQYQSLKRDLARRHAQDRPAYAGGKAEFIRTLLARAAEEDASAAGRIPDSDLSRGAPS